jgi:hypothetical protein
MMMTQQAVRRSAMAIAQAATLPRIFPPDRDQDWSKLTTIENESHLVKYRLNVITRPTHYS